jgi:hypothetical protein
VESVVVRPSLTAIDRAQVWLKRFRNSCGNSVGRWQSEAMPRKDLGDESAATPKAQVRHSRRVLDSGGPERLPIPRKNKTESGLSSSHFLSSFLIQGGAG